MVSSLTTPPTLVKPFANEGDKNTIPTDATGTQAASLEEGFPVITATPINEGGIPPKREDFNGLGFLTTSQYFYLQNGGRFTFNSTVSAAINGYPEGAVLQYTNLNTGQSYEVTSLIPNNTYNFVTNPEYIDGLKWRKSFSEDLTNYVTTNTQQDITGFKNFSNDGQSSGNAQIEITAGNIDASSAPASNKSGGIVFKDKNGTRIGKINVLHYTSGGIGVQLNARNGGATGIIQVAVDETGGVSTHAPTPASSDNSSQIATTAFVKSVLSSSGNGLATISKARSGYCQFTNGLIVQWGYSSSFGTDSTITFPKSFSSATSYTVLAAPISSTAYGYPTYMKAQTATNCTGRRNDSNKPATQWLAIGY